MPPRASNRPRPRSRSSIVTSRSPHRCLLFETQDKLHRKAKKPKKKTSNVVKPVDKKAKKAKASREKWSNLTQTALDIVADEQPAAEDKGAAADGDDANSADGDDEIDYNTIASLFPHMPLSLVLEAEQNFVKADADGSGLIELEELDAVLPGTRIAKTDVIKIAGEIGADLKEGLSFINCLEIITRIQQRPSLSTPASPGGTLGSSSNPRSNVCAIQ
eukprot:m.119254 g.119254  ORF g.119254 m.119254 type:complete len:218 (+) comp9545_c0_seq3:237-890(+)